MCVETEGIIKFHLEFKKTTPIESELIEQLEPVRQRCRQLGLIGGHLAGRYQGLGFGNISMRVSQAAF